MTRPSPAWYLTRLRGMSPREVAYRSLDAGRRRLWARRQVQPGAAPPLPRGTHTERIFASTLPESVRAEVTSDLAAGLLRSAEAILAGTWTVLGVRRADSADPDWFADPVTGHRAPDRQLAFRVQHRDETETGNIKQVWEMSRHHHLTVLAAAWWVTQDERYADAVADQLRSWFRANPFLTGVHWTSGIEAGVRLISWTWIRRLLDDWPKVGDLFEHNDDAVRQIFWHQQFLAGFPSRGSSANNHVLAEAAGQLIAACAFPWYSRSAGWRQSAIALLECGLAANTFDDGVNREQASDYHRFVLELCLVAAVEADAHDHGLSESSWQHLARMLGAAAAMVDSTGRPPRQGDADEGRALVLDDQARDPWATVLASGAALFDAPAWFPSLEGGLQEKLLGAVARPRRLPLAGARPRQFPDAGLVLLRSRSDDGPEIWCRCDSGPHGFLSIAAHGHADALSLEVRHEGVDILADPGTYCYHGELGWRRWFRSTAAHNTLEIGGVSQSDSGGPFLWKTQAQTTTWLIRDVGERPVQTWTGEHDGYLRLATPAIHRRSARLDSPGRSLTVIDTLDTPEPVGVSLSWLLGPDVQVQLKGAHAALSWGIGPEQRRGLLILPKELTWTCHRGEVNPIAGWYSPRFGARVPTTSLIGRGMASSSTRLFTALELP